MVKKFSEETRGLTIRGKGKCKIETVPLPTPKSVVPSMKTPLAPESQNANRKVPGDGETIALRPPDKTIQHGTASIRHSSSGHHNKRLTCSTVELS